jgi:hypothetical protein
VEMMVAEIPQPGLRLLGVIPNIVVPHQTQATCTNTTKIRVLYQSRTKGGAAAPGPRVLGAQGGPCKKPNVVKISRFCMFWTGKRASYFHFPSSLCLWYQLRTILAKILIAMSAFEWKPFFSSWSAQYSCALIC